MPELYDYTIKNKTFRFSPDQSEFLLENPPKTKEDWKNPIYSTIKTDIKLKYIFDQDDRCCYCRNYVEPGGYYEPIDHVVAKSDIPGWMFEPKNLIVSCDPCNNLKNADNVLSEGYNSEEFPNHSRYFQIFNPHFDQWGEHFRIENDIFLVCKDTSKAKFTYEHCHLFRYNIPVNFARENKLENSSSAKKVAHRIYEVEVGTETYNELLKALEHYEKRINRDEHQ